MRKYLILFHRYLGNALSLVFVSWFASGIAMLYARGMPRLTPDLRLERLAPVDMSAVRLSAAEALERAELFDEPSRVTLLTVMDRPAYRFTAGRESTTVFADSGDLLLEIDAAQAQTVAAAFVRLPENRLHYVGRLTSPDQWSLTMRQGPMYKFTVDDGAGTELYVSERNADVTVITTRRSRALAWIGAIPHFFYFAPLRLKQPLWRQVVLWTAGLGIALALLGIVLGIMHLRITRPFSVRRISSYLPYSGWMRWHYVSGLVFGLFALTFVFSGWLSMEPFGWATSAGRFAAKAFSSAPRRSRERSTRKPAQPNDSASFTQSGLSKPSGTWRPNSTSCFQEMSPYSLSSQTIATRFAPSRRAVSISCTFIRKPPSPWIARTGASGRPSLAPSATGKAKPRPPRSSGVSNVPGRVNCRWSYPNAGHAPASRATGS